MFAANPATLERMHTSTFMPELADRKLREQWEQEGSSSIHQRALNKVFDILSIPNSATFDADVDARIRKEFDGLVAGEAGLQEGWQRFDIGSKAPLRERRPSRRRQKQHQ
jgi:trimethylamine--corrinoid protein Co-methyltransferase